MNYRRKKQRPAPSPSLTGPEVTKRGATLYDWRDPYHLALTLGWWRFLVLLMGIYLGINGLFAGLYLLQAGSIANAPPGSLMAAFFFSIETLATVGYGAMSPATTYGHIVASVEILSGMTLTAIMTGLVFVRFSRAKSKILFADNPIITLHNGQPTLMVRVGNGRMSKMGNASGSISVRLLHKTSEGTVFRVAEDLKLIRPRIPTFDLTWTLMHVLDEISPLHNASPASLAHNEAMIIVTVEARDHALGAMVYDLRQYPAATVLHNHRYQDTVNTDAEGRVHADMSRLSWVEPLP